MGQQGEKRNEAKLKDQEDNRDVAVDWGSSYPPGIR